MTNTSLENAIKHYQQGELDQALQCYQDALEQDPESASILHAIGAIKAQLNDYDSAIEAIDKAIAIEPDNASIYNSKANILARLEQFKEAATCYNQAIKANPQYAIAYSGLGKCFYQQNKLKLARSTLEKAIAINPGLTDALYNYALVLIKDGDPTAAIKTLEPLVTAFPNFSPALGQLGELYLETHDYEKALKVLDRRAELEPDNPEAIHSLAQALALTNHLEESVEFYEKTLMLDPHHPEANHNLAISLLKTDDPLKALNYLFRQNELSPLAESYYNIGVIMMYQERNKEATQYFEQARALDPSYLPTYLNLGAIYLKQQRYQDAVAIYEKALELDPKNDEIRYIIGALSNDETPERAPNDYLKNLFDQYANHYDEHLTKYLEYTVPAQLEKLLTEETGLTDADWRVLDLGCGTGLSGVAFKRFANELIGIDISSQMVEIADKKSIYDQLIIGDIEQELETMTDVDLIVAADVFTYIGVLDDLFKLSSHSLKSQGYLLFSVERTFTEPYELQKNMRYAHTAEYIESLAKTHAFSIIRCNNAILRKQQKQPVEGYLYLLQK